MLACISGRMTGYGRTRNIIASSKDLMMAVAEPGVY
jgi:hypothetical protein